MTRYALVPVEATETMVDFGILRDNNAWGASLRRAACADVYRAMTAASPGGGRVTAEMVEEIARIIHGSNSPNQHCRDKAHTIRVFLGLQVEGDGQEGEGK